MTQAIKFNNDLPRKHDLVIYVQLLFFFGGRRRFIKPTPRQAQNMIWLYMFNYCLKRKKVTDQQLMLFHSLNPLFA